jgi:ABC-2 type transport system ATP-binding protein
MNRNVLHKEAEKLRLDFIRDPVSCYRDLVDFSIQYAPGYENHKDSILLGSLISELMENNSPEFNKEEGLTRIRELAERMLATVLEENNTTEKNGERIPNTTKEFFLHQRPENTTVFTCRNISKKLSGTFSLRDISLNLELGEITGLVGENGNGKTSLLRIIAGELRHEGGSLSHPFFDNGRADYINVKRSVGYVTQSLLPWKGINSVRQQLQFTAAIKGITGAENERAFINITDRLGLHNFKHKMWSELSGGYKLRFELARQLIWRPKLLILDEPLANLDIKTQLLFLNDLRSLTNSISHSMAVIISSQNIYEIEKVADNMVFIRDGATTYNGRVKDMGNASELRCYEIDTDAGIPELQKALGNLQIKEIRSNSFYKIIFAGESVNSDVLLRALADQHIAVSYFRDITHSTRLLFEK